MLLHGKKDVDDNKDLVGIFCACVVQLGLDGCDVLVLVRRNGTIIHLVVRRRSKDSSPSDVGIKA